jgi:hypothetical protein
VSLTENMSNALKDPVVASSPLPALARLASIPLVVVVVLVGVWVSGALVTDDEKAAKALTGLWFLLAGVMAVGVGRRWRPLALPVIGTFVVVAGVTGGFLLYTSTVDQVVDEDIVVADSAAPDANGPAADQAVGQPSDEPKPGNVEVATGSFVAGAHPTTGTATVIEASDGQRILTLTDFATDPGPDLRVYVVPSGAEGVDGGASLGPLKGNKGDQQYALPKGADVGGVVIWCRAFSVSFGAATLK